MLTLEYNAGDYDDKGFNGCTSSNALIIQIIVLKGNQ